jgi:hypothetical protein
MTVVLFFILIFIIFVWYVLMQIHGDTTFNWQMQKELLWELQKISKALEDKAVGEVK